MFENRNTCWKIPALAATLIFLCAGLLPGTPQQEQTKDSYILPPAPIADYINRDKNFATLDQMSPDGDHFYIASTTELSTLKLMSQKIYRLAMLKVTPETNRELDYSTYGIFELKIYSLADKTTRPVKVPPGTFFSDLTWSPDGKKLAFLANLPKGSQVWIADAATGEAKPLSEAFVMATLAKRPESGGRGGANPLRLIQWLPDGSIATLLVPGERGPEPAYNPVPSSPMIRRSLPKPLLHDRAACAAFVRPAAAQGRSAGDVPGNFSEPGRQLSADGQNGRTLFLPGRIHAVRSQPGNHGHQREGDCDHSENSAQRGAWPRLRRR